MVLALDPVTTSAVISAGTKVLGTILGMSNAKKQQEYQAELQRKNWEYAQTHAHQFEIEDLKNAGLNPILSATNSQLASMPSVSSVNAQNPLEGISDAIASAQELQERKAQRLQDLAIKDAEQDLELKRINAEKERLALDKWKAENEVYLGKEQLRYQGMSTVSQIQRNEAEIRKWNEELMQAWSRLGGELELMKSTKSVNEKQCLLISHQVVKTINESNLLETQKDDLRRKWHSFIVKAEEMTAKQRYEYLDTNVGLLFHQIGYGFQLLNPFTAISSNVGDLRVGVRR